MAGIGTCLWFDGQAEEAANFYVGLFPNSRIGEVLRWGGNGPGVPGSVLTISFELDGRSSGASTGDPSSRSARQFPLSCSLTRRQNWTKSGTP